MFWTLDVRVGFVTTSDTTARSGFRSGLAAIAPLLLGVVPFALIVGVLAAQSVIGTIPAWATGFIIFAGAAQLVTLELFEADAAAIVIIATALVVNLRHMMYSAALAEPFRAFPSRWRLSLPYLMTDQAFALSITHFEDNEDPVYRRWYFFGTGIGLWVPWQIGMTIGALLGTTVPDSWSLEFAVPLVFLVLVVLAVRNIPTLVAAAVGGTVAVLAMDAPYNLGLMLAAALGVAGGVLSERRRI